MTVEIDNLFKTNCHRKVPIYTAGMQNAFGSVSLDCDTIPDINKW